MRKVAAALLSVLLVQCEWQYSLAQVFKAGNDCSTSCCTTSCSDKSESNNSCDDNDKSPGAVKNCCISCCCYLPSSSDKIPAFAVSAEMIYHQFSFYNHSFNPDCFHPPELV